MPHLPTLIAATVMVLLPALAPAEPLDCPDAPAVFSRGGGGAAGLDSLSRRVGSAELRGSDLRDIASGMRKDYPDAGDAEIADLMITAYCHYLDEAPADHRDEGAVRDFEQQVYAAVFGGPPPETYPRQGWLYGN